jgi:hypothetical protein
LVVLIFFFICFKYFFKNLFLFLNHFYVLSIVDVLIVIDMGGLVKNDIQISECPL